MKLLHFRLRLTLQTTWFLQRVNDKRIQGMKPWRWMVGMVSSCGTLPPLTAILKQRFGPATLFLSAGSVCPSFVACRSPPYHFLSLSLPHGPSLVLAHGPCVPSTPLNAVTVSLHGSLLPIPSTGPGLREDPSKYLWS